MPSDASSVQRLGFDTRVIHAGQAPDPSTGAIMPPIYATSTYVQQSPGVHKGLDYGRSHNPTRWALERCVADLESGAQAFAFASGMSAIATVLELLDAGAHVVAGDDLYGGTYRLFERVRRRSAGQGFSFVDHGSSRRARRGAAPGNGDGVGRDAEQSAAEAGRSRRDRAALSRSRHPVRRGQHVREPVGAAAARARLRHRRALDDEVPERALGRHRRRGDRRRRAAPGTGRRAARVPAERRRRHRRSVRQLPRAART